MKNAFLALFALVILSSPLLAQDHFLVEWKARSPDIKSMVAAYEGNPAIPIMAKDLNGKEHSIMNMRGKNVFLWFWNLDCPKCLEQIDDFNLLAQNYPDDLVILTFSDNSKEEMRAFAESRPIDFPIIPKSKTLADGPYGGDLGYPRLFIIDKSGIVKYVIPEQEMRGDFKPFQFLEMIHNQIK